MKYLMFQIYAPLQAWGLPLPGNIRLTDDHPSKSGIIGYIANTLGITDAMGEEFALLSQSFGFACREDRPGSILKDFHIVQANPPYNNIISERTYLVDAAFTICLWAKNDEIDYELTAQAIDEPCHVPFLGRKNCVTAIAPNPKVIEADNIKEAFEQYNVSEFTPKSNKNHTVIYWEGNNSGMAPIKQYRRHDQPVGIRRRVTRTEFMSHLTGGEHVSQ